MKNKPVYVFKDGSLIGRYQSIIEAVYAYHISYAIIKKSIEYGTYVRRYKFCKPHF